jgi:release factor glutamine methyltransferase
MKLGLLKALYIDELKKTYRYSEAESIFYIILEWVEKKNKTHVILGIETILIKTYQDILLELKSGKPVQYITNETFFYSIHIYVDENVLIPRPETEELVHWIMREQKITSNILDIGTGSGCIALALKKGLPNSKISGCDISKKAIKIAKRNADQNNLYVNFFELNILNNSIDQYDIIVSNPPYIAQEEKKNMHNNVLDHEPHLALFVDDLDPLLFYKRIANQIKNTNTTAYFETSEFYTESLDKWLVDEGFFTEWKLDFHGKKRFLKITN